MIHLYVFLALELTVPLIIGIGYLISKLGSESKLYEEERTFKGSLKEVLNGMVGTLPLNIILTLWPPTFNENLFNPLLILAIFLVQDLYFFLAHKLLHMRPFLKIHGVHHRSINSRELDGIMFHPVEFFLHSLIGLFLYVTPMGFIDIFIFFIFSNFFILAGHHNKNILGNFKYLINTRTHHMHHTNGKINYGLYTNIYDRLIGTYKDTK
jgi:sterol desaturase/sphingolipid hydroxylase (fatty acid hydroxylase superfamily)